MSLKNIIKATLQRLLPQTESPFLLGIALRQKSLAFCESTSEHNARSLSVSIPENDYLNTLSNLASSHDVKGQTHVVLSPHHVHIVQVAKPNVPDEELLGALKWLIKDLVSVPPDDMLIDYFDGPKIAGVEKLHVVCASLSAVKGLIDPLFNNPFTLRSIITEEFAFAHLIKKSSDATLLVCQQPNEEIVLIIVKDGAVFFNRRLRGFSQIALKSESELEVGLIDTLSLEIQRSTDYFERQLKQAPIKSIEVLLPMKSEGFLARKLSENTNVNVNLLTLPEGFSKLREDAAAVGAIMPAYQALYSIDNNDSSSEEEANLSNVSISSLNAKDALSNG